MSTTRAVRLTDGVLHGAIAEHIAGVPPERGAVLMGFGDLVSLAVIDDRGGYTPVEWALSADLVVVVPALEAAGAGRLLGTVHSHPAAVTRPSSTDLESNAALLRANPHLDSVVALIVTEGEAVGPLQVAIAPRHRVAAYRVHLRRGRPVCAPVAVETVPIAGPFADAGAPFASSVTVAAALAGPRAAEPLPRGVVGDGAAALLLPVAERRTLLVPAAFPAQGPCLLVAGGQGVEPVACRWDAAADPGPQLADLVRGARRVAGATDRVEPVVGRLDRRRVLVAGCGSVGSRIAEDLVRAGVGAVVLLDPDEVTAPNLARSVYTVADLGRPKTEALAERLAAIAPALGIRRVPTTIAEADLPGLLADVDLVVGATDDLRQQFLLAHTAYAAGIPMIACAMYRGAAAGEVVVALPAAGTPCIACSLGGDGVRQDRPEPDYGLRGRLTAEPGLGAAIQLVASAASLLACAVLAGPGSALEPLVAGSVGTGRTLAMIATAPAWSWFPGVIEGEGHQLAPQSVWLRPRRDGSCVVCGDPEARVPAASGAFAAGVADLVAVLADDGTR